MKIRILVATMVMAALVVGSAKATNIWLSTSGTTSPLGEIPEIYGSSNAQGQKLYVWARPDAGKTLQGWSLNLRSTNNNVIDFKDLVVQNPVLDAQIPGVDWASTFKRYQIAGGLESEKVRNKSTADTIKGFGAVSINFPGFTDTFGTGLSDYSKGFDPYYSVETDAWLLATVTYDVTGVGKTDLFLQIGDKGILNTGELSRDHWVVFGDPNDKALRGGAPGNDHTDDWDYRGKDSATADATIVVAAVAGDAATLGIPEPSSCVLAALGMLSILALASKGQRHGRRS